ncbi:hypothetical protein [Rhizorhabdus argentea]|uniref:hypothetical protein n=1 Tax=Rhizorhabdus argentea TaxID=1387174 RepID=UPI0030EC10CB
MAYLQLEVPPSTAPAGSRSTVRPATAKPSTRRARSKVPTWIAAAFVILLLLAIPGYVAARATESVAMGILGADLVFLLAVAGWSAVAGGTRR